MTDGSSSGGGSGGGASDDPNEPVLNKKEEMWIRRWARAKELFEEKGVVLKAWRVGEDVADEAVRLVEGVRGEMGTRNGRDKEKGEGERKRR